MAANLSAMMDDTDKVRHYHEDGIANGLVVLPPDINVSDYRFVPVDRNTVRFGLGAIRGTGESAIRSILAARAAGPFTDLFDFCRRVDKRLVNRRAIEALVRAGAFDALAPERAALLGLVGMAMGAAEQAERQAAQNNLFGDAEPVRMPPGAMASVKPWDMRQKLLEEKVALGFYLSGHLFAVYAPALEGFPRTPLAKLQPSDGRTWMAGIVAQARTQMTRRGKMLVVTLDDGSAQVEMTVFAELCERHRDKLKEDALLVILGKVQRDEFSGGMRVSAEEIFDLAGLRERYAARLRIALNGQADAKRLMEMLGPYRVKSGSGACGVTVHYENESAACDVALGEAWRVRPDERLIETLAAWLEPHNVRVVYGTTG
jgi:DNA polymerase-3 subunit alpha